MIDKADVSRWEDKSEVPQICHKCYTAIERNPERVLWKSILRSKDKLVDHGAINGASS